MQVDSEIVRRYSYTDHFVVDVEGPFDLGERRYDAVVGFAKVEGMAIDLLTGEFLLRWSGSRAENSALWLRQSFPALAGEVYFSLQIPVAGE